MGFESGNLEQILMKIPYLVDNVKYYLLIGYDLFLKIELLFGYA